MDAIQIDRFFKRNAANNHAQQPPRWACDCCGATLAAWAITDTDGRVWGKTCYLKAIGKNAKVPAWTAMEKAATIAAHCWPVGSVVRHWDGREWTVIAAAWVAVVNGRPVPWVTVRRSSGSVADINPMNLRGDGIVRVTGADGALIYRQGFEDPSQVA